MTTTNTTANHIVQLENISKSYYLKGGTEVPILHNIDMAVAEGEMIAILGQSGSGKSTLMNLIGGLDVPTEGDYYFGGECVNDMNSNQLAQLRSKDISFIFQSFHLLSSKTVYQNVKLPLLYQRGFTDNYDEYISRALSQAALEKEHWHKRPNQLSGGQRQRAAIARALVARPRLLLADEPTGNLDSHTGENIIDSLQELNRQHDTTIVIVTHDESLTEVVHRVINIKDGRTHESN